MARLISIRKLAALDMAWLGARVILAEYTLGVLGPLALGALTLRAALSSGNPLSWQGALGVWLLGIGVNYVPLLLYAAAIARAGSASTEGRSEMPHARRYGAQQVILLVPFLAVVVALLQERNLHTSAQE